MLGSLKRYRWYACNYKGVPSWRCKLYSKHDKVKFNYKYGVANAVLANRHMLCLDVIDKCNNHYAGFLETEKPTKGKLACFREEWHFTKGA